MKWRKLHKESLDTYKCHRCRRPTREDRFRLPGLCNSWFADDNSKDLWETFIKDNMAEIKKL